MTRRVLVVGGGGREAALVRALGSSPSVGEVAVAPGNAAPGARRWAIDPTDHDAVVARCRDEAVDLVVVGPEAPLVAGLADALRAAGIRALGPTSAGARLEGSKSYARERTTEWGIPGPRWARVDALADALAWIDAAAAADPPFDVVVKADGLAGGKGVIVPDDHEGARDAVRSAYADRPDAAIVLEERLSGPEMSLIGLSDGSTVVAFPLAQDHKRVGEGDTGPNTGGMGAYAPVPGHDRADVEALAATFLQPAIDGMAADGTPYVGFLYAGLMVTDAGPRLIEYNCRLGDPEAQVLLPLVDGDLGEWLVAAADGRLADVEPAFDDGAAATVVVCAEGYPAAPRPAVPLGELPADTDRAWFVHAGTAVDDDGALVSSGGRVLAAVGRGSDVGDALDAAYGLIDRYGLDDHPGLFARRDIGWRVRGDTGRSDPGGAYARAGVDIDGAERAVRRIAEGVASTHDERVLAGVGSFGGVYDVAGLGRHPVLVASTDTCGTKPLVAQAMGRWRGLGHDIVGHSVNDVLVQGARPLFLLDTISAARLDGRVVAEIVGGMVDECLANGCVLLGGETAEVPGMVHEGGVDVAGTIVGVVERDRLLPRPTIAPGHVLLGLASTGLHTNGFSLARAIAADVGYDTVVPGDGRTLGDALLAPHRSYEPVLRPALDADLVDGLAHITGGGFVDNVPRMLPEGLEARIDRSSWEVPPLFAFLCERGDVPADEAYRVFNMGIGMVVAVAPDRVADARAAIGEPTVVLGEVVAP